MKSFIHQTPRLEWGNEDYRIKGSPETGWEIEMKSAIDNAWVPIDHIQPAKALLMAFAVAVYESVVAGPLAEPEWEPRLGEAQTGKPPARLEWEPELGDTYYIPEPLRDDDLFTRTRFDDDSVDAMRKQRGLICRTASEAIALAEKMLRAAKE